MNRVNVLIDTITMYTYIIFQDEYVDQNVPPQWAEIDFPSAKVTFLTSQSEIDLLSLNVINLKLLNVCIYLRLGQKAYQVYLLIKSKLIAILACIFNRMSIKYISYGEPFA